MVIIQLDIICMIEKFVLFGWRFALHKHAFTQSIDKETYDTNHVPPPTNITGVLIQLTVLAFSSFVSLPLYPSIMHSYDKDITRYHNIV